MISGASEWTAAAALAWTIGAGVIVAVFVVFGWVVKMVYSAGLTLKGIEKDLQILVESRASHKTILDDHEGRLRHVENTQARACPTLVHQ